MAYKIGECPKCKRKETRITKEFAIIVTEDLSGTNLRKFVKDVKD